MNMIKITLLAFFMAISIGATSSFAFAEEATTNSKTYIDETISHVEQALAEAKKSDFNNAQVHIKAARASAEKVTDHEDEIKKAKAFVIQAQVAAKKGNVENTSANLAKALDIYKSL
jgi:cellobiose-specific phosphotransferase system component IIA